MLRGVLTELKRYYIASMLTACATLTGSRSCHIRPLFTSLSIYIMIASIYCNSYNYSLLSIVVFTIIVVTIIIVRITTKYIITVMIGNYYTIETTITPHTLTRFNIYN